MKKENRPFFAILGPHSSGSSAVAGAIAQFNTFFGFDLFGFYGKAPYYGCEDHKLVKILNKYVDIPDISLHGNLDELKQEFIEYIDQVKLYTNDTNTVPVIKYPTLLACTDLLQDVLGDSLHVIYCDRVLDKSIQSLHKRFPSVSYKEIEKHQAFLFIEGYKLLDKLPNDRKLIVNFGQLCNNREEGIDKIINFMQLKPTDAQRLNAIYYIDDSQRHIK